MHHKYHGAHVDMAVVHSQAHKASMDGRFGNDTTVHDHPYGTECKGHEHAIYLQTDDPKTPKVFHYDDDEPPTRMVVKTSAEE